MQALPQFYLPGFRVAFKLKRRALAAVCAVLLLSACGTTEPVVKPTELTSIDKQTRVDRLWKYKFAKADKGVFQPFVLDNTVFAASRSGEVVALESESGKLKWRRKLDATLSSGIAGVNNVLFVSNQDGVVIALNAANGNTLWETPASSEVLKPISAAFGFMVVRSADGRLLSLNPADGTERWSSTYTPPALTLNGYSRPLLLDGGVLVGLDDGRLLALSSEDGSLLWESVLSVPSGRSEIERLVDIDGSIRVDDNGIYVVNYQGRFARVEPAKGQIVWSVPMSSTAGLDVSDTTAVVVADDDTVQGFDKSNGQLLWTQEALKHRRLSAPQFINDKHVLIGDVEGYLHTIDSASGNLVGRSRVAKKTIYPEMVMANDIVYVQSADGIVSALSAAE